MLEEKETMSEEVELLLLEVEEKMQKSLESAKEQYSTVRTGRASPGLVSRIQVEYYGSPTNLQQLASISVPEPRTLMIQPFDRSAIAEIERAILKSDLGITPNNDGQVIRLNIPPLNEERRRNLAKVIKKMTEEAKIAVRNIRRDGIEQIKKFEKDGSLPKDTSKNVQDDVQKLTDKYTNDLDKACSDKEKELLET